MARSVNQINWVRREHVPCKTSRARIILAVMLSTYLSRLTLPVWDPSASAGAAAAFAGILAALLLSVTLQIVLLKPAFRAAKGRINSLMAAPIALFLLLVSAYLYVVLSGTESRVLQYGPECTALQSDAACFPLGVPAAMFAVSGSYLALGAVTVAFLVALVVAEHPTARYAGRGATQVFFAAGSLAALLLVVWGYRDAYSTMRVTNFGTVAYLSESAGLPLAGWLSVVIGAAVGIATACGLRLLMLREKTPGRWAWRLLTGAVLTSYLVGPVIWYLTIQDTALADQPIGYLFLTQVMLGWVTLGIAHSATWLVVTWRGDATTLPDDAPCKTSLLPSAASST